MNGKEHKTWAWAAFKQTSLLTEVTFTNRDPKKRS